MSNFNGEERRKAPFCLMHENISKQIDDNIKKLEDINNSLNALRLEYEKTNVGVTFITKKLENGFFDEVKNGFSTLESKLSDNIYETKSQRKDIDGIIESKKAQDNRIESWAKSSIGWGITIVLFIVTQLGTFFINNIKSESEMKTIKKQIEVIEDSSNGYQEFIKKQKELNKNEKNIGN